VNALSGPWLVLRIRGQHGIYWCAAWFALQALAMFVTGVLETGAFELTLLFAVSGLHAFVALGLLRGMKSAWHIAAFLAFATMVLKLLATACAPGDIADGDKHLLEAALDIVVLAIVILIFGYLRKPFIRKLYNVPETYRIESKPE
jgi:hypothetical protein